MRKLPSRKLLGAIIASALLIPYEGYSLGLGEIEVNSALNQKLKAEIELLSASPEDAESLIVKLASRNEFARAGIDRPYLLNDLRFKSEVINGVPHIIVTSGSPVREPFLNFLVEVDWPNGHLLREYTILLDPPVFMTQSSSKSAASPAPAPAQNNGFRPSAGSGANVVPVAAPSISASSRPASQGMASQGMTSRGVSPQPAVTQPAPATSWVPAPVIPQQNINQPAGSYRIKSGDTAWSLADAMRPDNSITVPQMLVALLQANPESFINENVNGLKRGYILRVPDYNDIASINQADAAALVQQQATLWRQYQQAQSGGQPVTAMPADGNGAAGADMTSGGSGAHLEIVSAGSGSSASGSKDPTQMTAAELRAELALARERVETEKVEKEALEQRVNALQQRVDKMKGMLTIEDEELAGVQSLGDAAQDEMVQAEPVMQDEATIEEMGETGQQVEAEMAEPEMDQATEGAAGEEGEAIFVDEMAADEAAETAADTEPAEQADKQPETIRDTFPPMVQERAPQDPLSQLLNNPMMLAAAGGGLLLVAALIGLIIKRRKATAEAELVAPAVSDIDDLESLADDIAEETAKEEDDLDDVADEAKAESAEEEFDSTSTMILDSAEDTVITEAQPEAEEEEEPRDDVIAEADVYLAYGIYQQAEELLKQAINDNPDRDDYRVKLAETHYASKNSDAFVHTAEELKSRVGEDSTAWKKVVGMGQDLCADHPMFQGSMVGTPDIATLGDAPEMDFDLGDDMAEASDAAPAPDLDEPEALELPEVDDSSDDDETEEVDELEFDLSDTGAVSEDEIEDDEFSLDIDASELEIDSEESAIEAQPDEELEEEILDLEDTDIGLDTSTEEVAGDVVEEIGDVDIDFGLDDSGTEVETQGEVQNEASGDEEVSIDLTDEVEDLDFDLGDEPMGNEPAKDESVDDVAAMMDEMSLDDSVITDSTELTMDQAVEDELADNGPAEESPVEDISLDEVSLDEAAAEVNAEEQAAKPVPAADLDDDGDFDLSDLDDVDEISTKLDLARAYLDMGDHEGTRGILEEVLAEGNDEQKKEANELMANLD